MPGQFVLAFAAMLTLAMGLPAAAADIKTEAIAKNSSASGKADADMQAVLDKLAELGAKPIETLTPEEARKQPSPADAVSKLLAERGVSPVQAQELSGVTTIDTVYPNAVGSDSAARIYKPSSTAKNLPVILYIHGGGWVIADIETYDATPRALAKKANASVISVHYRQAPENKFPASHDDIVAAYKWVVEKSGQFGGDTKRIAIVGESAGGNMAINAAIAARDLGLQRPLHVVAVYPVAGTNLDTPSYRENANAKPLSKPAIEWFVKHLTTSKDDLTDPRLDLIGKADLSGLPPVTIITAEIDPLRSDGELLAAKLKDAGVRVKYRNFDGVTHEFFGMDAVVKDAVDAQQFAVDALQESLSAAN